MSEFNLLEETKLSMNTCLEGYIHEIIGSLKFVNPNITDEELNKACNAVGDLVETASFKLNFK
jgi:hypothetical protein